MAYEFVPVNRETSIFSAKRLLVDTIWKQANIEIQKGITFPETNEVLEGRVPSTLNYDEALTVNNIKRAWEYLFKHIDAPISFGVISDYNSILGEGGLIENGGKLRAYHANITGTEYVPPLPTSDLVLEKISEFDSISQPVERGLSYFSDIAKGQWFNDGNKRTASMVANHYLVQQGVGLFAMNVPEKKVFFDELIKYYEGNSRNSYHDYLYTNAFELMPSGLTPKKFKSLENEPSVKQAPTRVEANSYAEMKQAERQKNSENPTPTQKSKGLSR
ncbi:MAG: Fic family protein [Streptococcaceae bacterium]|jgi:hypothetical protein|nr:Fic family protein [Streptococcaceae bacterium]